MAGEEKEEERTIGEVTTEGREKVGIRRGIRRTEVNNWEGWGVSGEGPPRLLLDLQDHPQLPQVPQLPEQLPEVPSRINYRDPTGKELLPTTTTTTPTSNPTGTHGHPAQTGPARVPEGVAQTKTVIQFPNENVPYSIKL